MNSTDKIFEMSFEEYIATKGVDFELEDYRPKRYNPFSSPTYFKESDKEIAQHRNEDMWDEGPLANSTPRKIEISANGSRPLISYSDVDYSEDYEANKKKGPFDFRQRFSQSPYSCSDFNGNNCRPNRDYNEPGCYVGVTDDNPIFADLSPLAPNFLNVLQVPQQQTIANEPKYNMEIQKNIHALQGKPHLYVCQTGNIVSSDGVGIADCRVTPDTTGISLNCRFA